MAIGNVRHIFGGIPVAMIRPAQSPEQNLAAIRPRLASFGINIHPACQIAYSTLREMLETINKTIEPKKPLSRLEEVILRGARADESEKYNVRKANGRIDFQIEIGPRTEIGENVFFGNHIHIGPNSRIGDRVRIVYDVIIGSGCDIERAVHIGRGCRIGDNARIMRSTTFGPETIVPPNSDVFHADPDCTLAIMVPRLRLC